MPATYKFRCDPVQMGQAAYEECLEQKRAAHRRSRQSTADSHLGEALETFEDETLEIDDD